jgi:ABC-2 type transport system ATP-binding protein
MSDPIVIRALTPEARARIGYLTEEHQLYDWMSVRECNEFQSAFYPRWDEKIFRGITGHFRLKPEARVKDLSRGERAGLCLALTLAPDPELLLRVWAVEAHNSRWGWGVCCGL